MKRSLTVFAILCALLATIEADIYELPISGWSFHETITVYIQFLKPSGIQAWANDTSSINMLKVRCDRMRPYINTNRVQWEHTLLENTTKRKDGKFMINDHSFMKKKDETIKCKAAIRRETWWFSDWKPIRNEGSSNLNETVENKTVRKKLDVIETVGKTITSTTESYGYETTTEEILETTVIYN